MGQKIYFNEAIDNSRLAKAIEEYVSEPIPETENNFIGQIANSRLYTPVQVNNAELKEVNGAIEVDYNGDVQVNYQLVSNNEGDELFPVFSTQAEYEKWMATSKHSELLVSALLSIDQFMAIVGGYKPAAGLVIDPFGANIVLDRANLGYLAEQIKLIRSRPEVEIVQSSKDQTEFAELLAKELPEQVPSIETVWALDLQGEQTQSVYVVATDAEADIEEAIARLFAFAKVSKKAPEFGTILGVAQLGYANIAEHKPIYNKNDL